MTSFVWKSKIGKNVSKRTLDAFAASNSDESNDVGGEKPDDPSSVAKKRKTIDDPEAQSEKLLNDGVILAESEKYWEALRKWNEAIRLSPENSKLYEMKAQVFMQVNKHFQAVQEAEKAVRANPRWWIAYQTLGRAQIGIGEVRLAIRNFSKAIHLNPDEEELWKDDLKSAIRLREHMSKISVEEDDTLDMPMNICLDKYGKKSLRFSSVTDHSFVKCRKTV